MVTRRRGRKDRAGEDLLGGIHIEGVSGQVVIGDNNVVATLNTTVVNRLDGPKPPITRLPPSPLRLGFEPEPVGRASLVDEIGELLGRRTTVQLYGPAGSGKSALLRAVARRMPADRQAVHLGAGSGSLDDLCQDLFEAVYEAHGYRPSDAERRRLLADVDATVVVDHVRLTDAEIDQLLDHAPRCVFLIGSRDRTLWRRGRAIELPPLEETDARELIAGELDREIRPAEAPVVTTAVRESGGLPARLLRCGAYLREIDLKGPADAAGHGVDADARTALLLSRASEPARRVLATLAGLPDVPVASDVLPALTGIDVGAEVLEEVVRSRLAVVDQDMVRVPSEVAAVVPREGGRFGAQEVPAAVRRLIGWTARREPAAVAGQADLLRGVLELAIEHEAYADARALARTASTRLAASKRLDAWLEVLVLGHRAAQAAKSSADVTFFRSGIEANRFCRPATAIAAGGSTLVLGTRLAQELGRDTVRKAGAFCRSSTPSRTARTRPRTRTSPSSRLTSISTLDACSPHERSSGRAGSHRRAAPHSHDMRLGSSHSSVASSLDPSRTP